MMDTALDVTEAGRNFIAYVETLSWEDLLLEDLKHLLPVTEYRQRLGRVNSRRLCKYQRFCVYIRERIDEELSRIGILNYQFKALWQEAVDFLADIEEVFGNSKTRRENLIFRGSRWYYVEPVEPEPERTEQLTLWEEKREAAANAFDDWWHDERGL